MVVPAVDNAENQRAMDNGELYWAFTDSLVAQRRKCTAAIFSVKELPEPVADAAAEEAQLENYPWIEAPFRCDYGSRLRISQNVFINFGCVILDTGIVTIKERCLFGPNVSLYAASHPLDPDVRNGIAGPELGRPITIEEDCWLCGNVTVLQGVTIGRGSTVAACSVVTKDVEPYTVVAGNPAKFVKIADGPAAKAYHERNSH
ncbi:hypothetical protein MNV49_002477 [Pseudohyphozyma bogoriensis]|nr:hypothetical protein MNV49_002477 [Pseudohyphozyma bogoriensis]